MLSKPVITLETPFSVLDSNSAFKSLKQAEAFYAYYFVRASWSGASICFFQKSFQSPALLYLLLKSFENGAQKTWQHSKLRFSEDNLTKIYLYFSAFLDNYGNYKAFGGTKFVPDVDEKIFEQFLSTSPYWSVHLLEFQHIYARISKFLFQFEKPYGLIDFSDKDGTTGYYSKNITSHEAEKVKNILTKKSVGSQNNRLIKTGVNKYVIKIASVQKIQDEVFTHDGSDFQLIYGEFSSFLEQVNQNLKKAKQFSANQTQQLMIENYIKHFHTGDMQKHKQSQRLWVKDVQPVIETNIGFVESYLDPLGVRAEFSGIVAIVNRLESDLLMKLVEKANVYVKYLPWGQQFEVEVFKKPDFTSLQVVAHGAPDIPSGINLPNYDDVREHYGYKNVNLINNYQEPTFESIQYTAVDQIKLHLKYQRQAWRLVVALHELLGHGSGKLLFQVLDIKSPLNGKPIASCYKPNEEFHGVFGEASHIWEECRADCVALYLSTFQDVQESILPSFSKEERWEIVYVGWQIIMMRSLNGLQEFDVGSNKWLESHMGSAYVIRKVLEEAGVVQILDTQKNGEPYIEISLKRQSIPNEGKQAISQFLKHLQIYKSTANILQGIPFFDHYLQMTQKSINFRETVLKHKKPRRLTVQPDIKLVEVKPTYVRFEQNFFGCIDSALSHFGQQAERIIEEWERSNQDFMY